MNKFKIFILLLFTVLMSCTTERPENEISNPEYTKSQQETNKNTEFIKPFDKNLPTIGLLMYNGVLQSEVIASSDVFAKANEDGKQLFNVVTIAETESPITTEEGMQFVPDYNFKNSPKLTVLFVPSAYDMYAQVRNENIINFIKEKNKETEYTVSNCAGAQLIGKSGIADGHKIVTWIGGGEQLQEDFPNLIVQDDSLVTFVKDGKFLSSNGNLASYISALELVELMTSKKHREFVESYLYLGRLKDWNE